MRTELDVLLDRVQDPALRADLRSQIARLQAKRTYGLVFESHIPERIRLPEHVVRVGVSVVYKDNPDSAVYEVTAISCKTARLRQVRNADGTPLTEQQDSEIIEASAALDAVVVITDFGEPVFPGLRRLDPIKQGGPKPAHVVIKGENYHVLEALQFTHTGKD
jgi:adenine-specific DNA-methyltransferase